MANWTVDIDLGPLEDKLRQLGAAAVPACEQGLFEWGEGTVAEAKELVPVNYGTLRGSGFVVTGKLRSGPVTTEPEMASAGVALLLLGFGGQARKYALAIHEGFKHWPPPGPLQEWAEYKLGLSEKEAKRAAFLIGRKLAGKSPKSPGVGYEGRKYLETPFKARAPLVGGAIADAINRAIAGLAR